MSLQLVNTIALGVIAIFTIGSIRVSYLHAQSKQVSRDEWLKEWISGFSTEMAGALLTAVLFGLIVGSVQQNQNEQELKQELVRQLDSQINDVAIQAAEALRQHRWLTDGSLQVADLWGANLQRANLVVANLQGTNLWGANLQGTNLRKANLQGASLKEANLQGADLSEAKLSENTTLPDSKYWTPDTDMTRFTDPDHQDFWRSDDPRSPAYHG